MSTGTGKRSQRQRVAAFRDQDYPEDWDDITARIKQEAGWECERCGHGHDPAAGYTLTTAHMIPDKSLVEDWNLAALCQRCHLICQHRIDFEQPYMFEHSDWLEWRVSEYEKWRAA